MLVEGDGAEEGEVDMAGRHEKRAQREQAAQDQGDLALDIATLLTASTHNATLNNQFRRLEPSAMADLDLALLDRLDLQ